MELKHGYTVADLDHFTRCALYRRVGTHMPRHERWEIARSGIATYLYEAAERPAPGYLITAGWVAISRHIEADLKHHGKTRSGETAGYAVAYWASPQPAPVDELVTERLVLREILAELRPRERQVLLAFAEHGAYARVAAELGVSQGTVSQLLHRARRRAAAIWEAA